MKLRLNFFALLLGCILVVNGCQMDCDIADDSFVPNLEEDTNYASAYPSQNMCDGITVSNSSNSFDEVGVFHNAFLEYMDIYTAPNYQTADSLLDYVYTNLVEFAISERSNYDFLPDDSTTCVTQITNWATSNPGVMDSSYYVGMTPTFNLPEGVSSSFVAYIDTFNEIFSDFESEIIDLDQFIDDVKVWESSIMNSTLVTSEQNKLLRLGSIARHTTYYWGCDDDVLRWDWLRRNWKVLAAFDIAGGLCCGIWGAPISSAGAGVVVVGWALGWLP